MVMSTATAAAPFTTKVLDVFVTSLVMGDDVRLDDDAEALRGLAESIRKHGVLQPLLVRPCGPTQYEIIAGRRRFTAARSIGLERVPCILRHFDDGMAFEAAMAENLHRRRLSPIEEALGYARLRDHEGLNQRQIGERVGRSGAWVGQLLRVLTYPAEVIDQIHAGKLAVTTAIDRAGRAGGQGGSSGRGEHPRGLSDDAASIISHWRRRHDRLLAGLQVLVRKPADDTPPRTADELLAIGRRLIRLDTEPLPNETT